jgi:hypothetical protein
MPLSTNLGKGHCPCCYAGLRRPPRRSFANWQRKSLEGITCTIVGSSHIEGGGVEYVTCFQALKEKRKS